MRPQVRWSVWPDGIVLFSPAAAETSLLPIQVEALLRAMQSSEGFSVDAADGELRSLFPLIDHLFRIAAVERIE